MVNRPHRRIRRGWTVIEMSIVVAVVVLLAAIALPNIDFARYRMDANRSGSAFLYSFSA